MSQPPPTPSPEAPEKKTWPCKNCGATMKFEPGVESLACPYCGHVNPIPAGEEDIEELDFHEYLDRISEHEETEEASAVRCSACGAETTLDPNLAADVCPFCSAPLVAEEHTVTRLKPRSLLPFKVSRDEAMEAFRQWLASRWFAPSELKKYARADTSRLNGMYVPYWTYDSKTTSWYRGERGEHYYTTETYTTTENGKRVTKTRRVQHTRWYPCSGVVWRNFDDLLILASRSLPKKHTDRLEPWDLDSLVSYDEQYLAGFRAETYQVDLAEGFEEAKDRMAEVIRRDVRHDIGGDEQRIHAIRTQHDDVTFKHLLLPIWISAYRYRDEVYRFLVNARTGEVQGERPWSWLKITLAALAALCLLGLVAWLFSQYA
jgi:DNA-directed RNA polymerase subunit RPC12/RpoP